MNPPATHQEMSPDISFPLDMQQSFAHLSESIERAASLLESACQSVEVASGAVASSNDLSLPPLDQRDVGPLVSLLEDDTVNDILVNGPNEIFVEQRGKLVKSEVVFDSHEQLAGIAENIARAVGRQINPKRPLVDARLPDGSRVNIVAPPLTLDGVSLSIRKFSRERITLNSMVDSGCMSAELAHFLECAAKAAVNIVVSGGTGSGKTTLLNAISQHIDSADRIVTIEDSAELQIPLPHVVRMETKMPEVIGDVTDEVSMRDLVKNALRMRPDRIIIGEVRGAEAFDMIQAMNTGHDGSMTTIHANTPRDGLMRMIDMIGMANLNIPAESVRNQITSAVNFIIQTARMDDGVRRVTHVSEIMGSEGEMTTMQDIFVFNPEGPMVGGKLQGSHRWNQVFPAHRELAAALRDAGVLDRRTKSPGSMPGIPLAPMD